MRTLSFPFEQILNLGTDASGNCAVMFVPQWQYTYAVGTMTGTSAAFSAVSLAAGFSSLSAKQFRLVNWGIELEPIVAPLYAAGTVYTQILPPGNGANSAYSVIDITDQFVMLKDSRSLQSAKFLVRGVKSSDADAQSWTQTTVGNTVPTFVTPGWCPIVIGIAGGPVSTSSLRAKVTMTFEVAFNDGDVMNFMAQPSPAKNSVVDTVVSEVDKVISPFVEGTKAKLQAKVHSYANDLLRRAAGGAARMALGPAMGGAVASLMDGPMEVN